MRPSANPAATVSPPDVNLLDNPGFRIQFRLQISGERNWFRLQGSGFRVAGWRIGDEGAGFSGLDLRFQGSESRF